MNTGPANSVTARARDLLLSAASQNSLGGRARAKRHREMLACFPELQDMSVLDLGGTSRFWRSATIRPAKVTTVNLGADDPSEPWLRHVVGDACNPDIVLGKQRFDLVFSNSVIEHVGGFHQRQQMARVVEERADAYWIQTPYRYFPIEPHFLAPGFQFLPLKLRVAAVLVWPIKRGTAVDRAGAMRKALSIELLSETEFRHLFPSAQIRREKVAGLTKSLIAVRTGRDD